MKPTPTKLVLLMSAAGLGLSWSGVSLAARDANAPPNFELTFGIPPRNEQTCIRQGQGALAPCQVWGGDLLQTAAASATSIPLALAAEYSKRSVDANRLSWAFDAYGTRAALRPQATRAGHDSRPKKAHPIAPQPGRTGVAPTLGRPNNAAPRPELSVAAQTTDGSDPERVADAIAMILLEDPQEGSTRAAPTISALTGQSTPKPQDIQATGVTVDFDLDIQVDVGKPGDGPVQALTAEAANAPISRSSDLLTAGSRETFAPAAVKDLGVALTDPLALELTSVQEGKADVWEDVRAGLPASGVHAGSRAGAQAGIGEDPTSIAPTSIERVLSSLAEVLGSQLEGSSPAADVSVQQTVATKTAVAVDAPIALAVLDPAPVFSVLPVDAASNNSKSQKRLGEADEIVVASHADKILLSLAALRSKDSSDSGRFGAQTQKTVVARHADKVLETLALFQPNKLKRAVSSCTRTPAEVVQEVLPSRTWDPSEFPGLVSTSATTAFALEAGTANDVSQPAADTAVVSSVLQAPAQTTLPDLPAAGYPGHSRLDSEMVALSADKLDEVRGGFVTDNGLTVSFGIERAIYLNGNLVTTTSLNVSDLSKISGGQAQVTTVGSGSLAIVQSGPGNTFLPGSISQSAAGTVIQNTLDNQKIQTITRIDAVVNSAGIMRSINLQSSMRSAIVESLRR